MARSLAHMSYPFAAVAGHATAKRALLLLAVEPELRGVLIASESGSAKSVLARAFASVYPNVAPGSAGILVCQTQLIELPIGVTEDRPGSAGILACQTQLIELPIGVTEDRPGSAGILACETQPIELPVGVTEDRPGSAGILACQTQLIELPVGVTEDRLLGGLDLERTLATGKRQVSRGLLAEANGKVLYMNSVNLLEPDTATHVARALDSRCVLVERESVSASHAADFVLVATFNPAEGEPSALLRDRVGLIVDSPDDLAIDQRSQIIERSFQFEKDPAGFAKDFESETARLKQSIEAARLRVPGVRVSKERRRQIADIAMRLAVEGNRADVFALKAARANAALGGRDVVEDEDVVIAVQLVLAPRAKALPLAGDAIERDTETSSTEQDHLENQSGADSSPAEIEDVIIAAIDALAPKDLLAAEQQRSRASRAGKRFKGAQSGRGRYVRSNARRTREAKIAVDATLRAAAPFQTRRKLAEESGARAEKSSPSLGSRRVKILPSDLRYKRFKHRSGIMFIFAVDASGSMALNRMAQAKGALTRLLSEAYLHRDKVALISFRGEGSKVLLAPTRSVELAKRVVDAMPAGGGTPISAGVLKAIEIARHSRLQGMRQSVAVLFTDGRANVPLCRGRAVEDELAQLGSLLRVEGIASIVVDTKPTFLSNSDGIGVARLLRARYIRLADARGDAAYQVVRDAR